MRFTVEKNWCDRDNMYFYDVVDHHPLRHRRVVSWYTEKPTFKGDRIYGYDCAKEDADHFNDISEEDMETALKALAAHTSQVPPEAIASVAPEGTVRVSPELPSSKAVPLAGSTLSTYIVLAIMLSSILQNKN